MSTCQSWLFFYFSLCKCNINSHHSHHGAIIINYLHNWTTSTRLPWKQKGGAWCNGWANTHLTYMKKRREGMRGRMIMLIRGCHLQAVTMWQSANTAFHIPSPLIPPALAAENKRKAPKPAQATAEHCNEQIKEKNLDLIALMDQKLHSVCACVHVWGWWGVWHSTVILIGTIQSVPGLNRLQLTLSALNVS